MNEQKYRVLICSTSVANYDRRMQRIGESLQDAGHEVSWVSRSQNNELTLKINHLPLNPMFSSGFLFYAFFNIRLFFKLLIFRFDVVYCVDLDTVLPCYLVSRIRNKKIVFDAHEYFTEVPELINRKRVKKVWQSIADFCLPKIKNNITVGPMLSQIFTERYKTKYTVVRNIAPNVEASLSQPKSKNTMVYLGVINNGRGIELAIDSLVELNDKRLKIIGGGDLFEEMQERAKSIGVDDRVEFVGFTKPEKIKDEMADAYLGLNLLMAESKSYYYSLANKFFDYLQHGLPTLNMAFPEYKNIYDSHQIGLLVDNYAVEDLVSAVRKMDDSNVYDSCLVGIKNAKKVFKWEIEEEKLNFLINNLN